MMFVLRNDKPRGELLNLKYALFQWDKRNILSVDHESAKGA